MRYPLDQDRATGFLMPIVGYSQTKGMPLLRRPLTGGDRPQHDATFSLDYYAAKAPGAASQYRYMFEECTNGAAACIIFTFKAHGRVNDAPPTAIHTSWKPQPGAPRRLPLRGQRRFT